jgi:general secretion pathway protein D
MIVKSSQTQSKKDFSGAEQSFDDVVIAAEETQMQDRKSSGTFKSGLSIGGNRLIIACRTKDWTNIKALIEQLDKPQLQIAIQVLIADLTFIGKKELKAHVRNPLDIAKNNLLPQHVNFQSGHISTIITEPPTKPVTLASDLLQLITSSSAQDMAFNATNEQANYGSMIISLADKANNSIWGLLKLLDRWIDSKIVTQIMVTVKNNEETRASNTSIRRLAGTADSQTVTATIPIKDFEATTSVTIKPRISSVDRLSLQISAQVEAFTGDTYNRKTQNVETSASINSGDILVLGGLAKINDKEDNTQWPLLGSIPIIGNLFKGNSQTREKSNLAIFIHPTIIDPKLRSGFNQLTDELIEEGKTILKSSELFSTIKDPITMLYFSNEAHVTGSEVFKDFQEQGTILARKSTLQKVQETQQEWERQGLQKLAELKENPFKKP